MGVPGPYVAAAFFGPKGALLRYEARQASGNAAPNALRPGKVRGEELSQLWRLLDSWKSELGFTPGTVTVTQFDMPHLGLGIHRLPRYLQEALDGLPPEPDEQYRHECLSDIEEWRRLDKFVVQWGNEYWMNRSGEVTDT
jgi:hypothetical protein